MAEDALGPLSKDRAVDSDTTFKNILIVDDINDQGTTLNWIMQDWPSGCFPDDPAWEEVWNNNVKFAVLVDNLASKCNVKMDYIGMEVNKAENDVWIDFPWEDWWTK
jgi:hypoxanthine-guanine phosphoribosyltransferase